MKQQSGYILHFFVHVLFSSVARPLIFIAIIPLPQLIVSKKSSMLFQMYAFVFPLLVWLSFKRVKISCIAKDLALEYTCLHLPSSKDSRIDKRWKTVNSKCFE